MTGTTWTPEGIASGLSKRRADLDAAGILDRLADARPVTVVIPVHNGGDVVRRCLDSVLRWTQGAKIVAIDDASTDGAMVRELDHLEATTRLELVRNATNHGYTATANHGLHLDDVGDVVLLNSDTEVGPLWLQRLRAVAASRANVATVTAVSDNAGAMAVPVPGVENDWPEHLPWSELARGALRADLPWSAQVPTAHGFCMLITRQAIDALTGFDEEAFPRGYGEENDFSLRASEAGMVNLLAPHVLVRHARGQSFGLEREELMEQGRRVLAERHPAYSRSVRSWMRSQEMGQIRRAHALLRDELRTENEVKPVRLYLIHASSGGTPATNLDLMTGLAHAQDAYLVEASSAGRLTLHQVHADGLRTLATWQAASRFVITDTFRRDYAEVLTEWILRLGVEGVHIRHLINQPFTALPEVCRRLGIPLVLSTHDFYMVCPSIQLLDQDLRFCGGRCTPGPGPCSMPTKFVEEVSDLKHSWIHEWRRRARSVFDTADAVIATTDNAAGIITSTYPELVDRIRVIEHGRDIERWGVSRPGERIPGPLRILAIANWAPHKGLTYLRSMLKDLGEDVEAHVMGQKAYLLEDVAVVHGPYQREALPALVKEIDPDLIALVSVWPETYSHTLSEAFALGVPIVATDIGAIAERTRRHGGGVLVPVHDPHAAAGIVRRLVDDRAELEALRRHVPRDAVRSRAAMVEDYRALYSRQKPPLPTVGVVIDGSLGSHPHGAEARVVRRLLGSSVAARMSARQVYVEEVLRTGHCDVDVLLVHGGVEPGSTAGLLRAMRRKPVRLVLDVAEWWRPGGFAGDVCGWPGDTGEDDRKALLAAAHQVIAPTQAMSVELTAMTKAPVAVVEDALCPRLWGAELPAPAVSDADREQVRILLLAAAADQADIAILRPVLPALEQALGRSVHLEVVGLRADVPVEDWYHVLSPPNDVVAYPQWVRWLRESSPRWAAAVAPFATGGTTQLSGDQALLELVGLGLPVVASGMGSAASSAGLATVVPEDPRAWCTALVAAMTDGPAAAERAHAIAFPGRTLPASDDRWITAVLGAEVNARRRG